MCFPTKLLATTAWTTANRFLVRCCSSRVSRSCRACARQLFFRASQTLQSEPDGGKERRHPVHRDHHLPSRLRARSCTSCHAPFRCATSRRIERWLGGRSLRSIAAGNSAAGTRCPSARCVCMALTWRHLLITLTILTVFPSGGRAWEASVELGLLTCSLAQSDPEPSTGSLPGEARAVVCHFRAGTDAPDETYQGTLQFVGQVKAFSDKRPVMMVAKVPPRRRWSPACWSKNMRSVAKQRKSRVHSSAMPSAQSYYTRSRNNPSTRPWHWATSAAA